MCNADIFTIAGTGMQAQSALAKGSATQSYYNYLATQNEIQAGQTISTSNRNVGAVVDAAATEETNLNRSVSALRGTQKAAMAANGVYSGGTVEDIARDTMTKAELDRKAIRRNADLKTGAIATEATNQAKALKNQATQFRMAGDNAVRASKMEAMSSILGGASQISSRWSKWMYMAPS